MGQAIGIDLGTTNSYVAHVTDGKAQIIVQKNGRRSVPSVFSINHKGEHLVGQEASELLQQNPTTGVVSTKRLLGQSYQSSQKQKQLFTYELIEGQESDVLLKIKDQVLTLENISGAILKRLQQIANEELQSNITECVLTVPAYFNDRQRQAIQKAGEHAELKILRIINEPTAAALAYGYRQSVRKRIAIYDLGGGTFDISVIEIKDNVFEVIAAGGNSKLGGIDFDDRIMQFILESFLDDYGIDLSIDKNSIQRIRQQAEQTKIILSTQLQHKILLENITADNLTISMDITRNKVNELTEDLVDSTISSFQKILTESGTTTVELDEVLLVGGQSKMPLVQEKLKSFLGYPATTKIHPDEAVALGAAVMAHSLKEEDAKITLYDVLPTSIGLRKADGTMQILFPKNCPIPSTKTKFLKTFKDDQKAMKIRIFQGEHKRVDLNEELGTYIFCNIPPRPKGEVTLQIEFDIDENGMLHVHAKDKFSKKPIKTLYNSSLPPQPESPLELTSPPPPTLTSEPEIEAEKPAAKQVVSKPEPSTDKSIPIQKHESSNHEIQTATIDEAKESIPVQKHESSNHEIQTATINEATESTERPPQPVAALELKPPPFEEPTHQVWSQTDQLTDSSTPAEDPVETLTEEDSFFEPPITQLSVELERSFFPDSNDEVVSETPPADVPISKELTPSLFKKFQIWIGRIFG